MSRMRGRFALLVTLLVAAIATGCGSSDDDGGSTSSGSSTAAAAPASGDTSWAGSAENAKALQGLYDAAVKAGESEVVMYGPYAELYRPIWEDFNKRFPKIKVTPKVLPGSGTVATLKAEVSSGKGVGDIIMQGLEGVAVPADEGLLMPFEPPTIGDLDKEYRDPENRYVVQFGDIYGTFYNTNKLKPEDLPKKLEDLTNPKYKGMIIDDPALGIVTAFSLLPIYQAKALSLDFMKGLKAVAKTVDDTTPYYNQINTGQVAMMPWGSYFRYRVDKEKGAPLGFDAVPGLSALILGGTGIVKSSPHPNAAKLWQSWFLTPEAQNLIVDKGKSVALMPGTKYPSDWPDYQKLYDAFPAVLPNDFHAQLSSFLDWVKPVFN